MFFLLIFGQMLNAFGLRSALLHPFVVYIYIHEVGPNDLSIIRVFHRYCLRRSREFRRVGNISSLFTMNLIQLKWFALCYRLSFDNVDAKWHLIILVHMHRRVICSFFILKMGCKCKLLFTRFKSDHQTSSHTAGFFFTWSSV